MSTRQVLAVRKRAATMSREAMFNDGPQLR